MNVEEIDAFRTQWVSEYPEIRPSDISAYIAKVSQQSLFQLYRHARKPLESEVISAAAIFFARFFTKESPLECHPRAVLVACMNLAAKTEEYHAVSLSDLVNALPDATSLKASVPILEMKLLAALGFDLVVEQPWPIQLYWAELLRLETSDDIHLKVYDISCDIMRQWQWTDAVLAFDFPQLATAVTLKACMRVPGSSPDDEGGNVVDKILRIMATVMPGVDVVDLLGRVEEVVNRFGHFDQLVRDPTLEKAEGYMRLVALIDKDTNVVDDT